MVAEDDAGVAASLVTGLKARGFEVTLACDGCCCCKVWTGRLLAKVLTTAGGPLVMVAPPGNVLAYWRLTGVVGRSATTATYYFYISGKQGLPVA